MRNTLLLFLLASLLACALCLADWNPGHREGDRPRPRDRVRNVHRIKHLGQDRGTQHRARLNDRERVNKDELASYDTEDAEGNKWEEFTTPNYDTEDEEDDSTDREGVEKYFGGGKTFWKELSLPEWLTPWMKGSLNIGPDIHMDWDVGSLFDEVNEWWKGPNVCTTREETEEEEAKDGESPMARHHVFTSSICDETESAYKCVTKMGFFGKTKTFTVIYECCHGYQREEGKSGCPKELVLKNVLETLEELEAMEFSRALDSVGAARETQAGNFTLFAPKDEAFQDIYPKKSMEKNIVLVSPEAMNVADNLEELMSIHVVEGFVGTTSMADEQLIPTINPKANVRINFYDVPKRLITANCVPVTSTNNLATNGMVHVVNKLLPFVKDTVMDIIGRDRELSTFKTILGKVGLSQMLREDGQFTLFVPTNTAFQKMNPATRDKLLRGGLCLGNVVKNHLLKNVICSSAISGLARAANILEKYVHLNGTEDGKVFVNGAQVLQKDVMATNGVIHIIDEVLLPDEALDILDVAKKAGANQFGELIDAAGLVKNLQTMDNFTVFIPTDKAIQNLPADVQEVLSTDPGALAKIMKYHIATSQQRGRDLHNDLELETLDSNKKIAIKEYSSFPFRMRSRQTAQCANIIQKDLESCAGVGHLVDRVLLPPKGDILDVLYQTREFSRLVSLMKTAGLSEDLQLGGPFTFLAPTNQAFDAMDGQVLRSLEEDPEKLKGFLMHHIIHDALCCEGVFERHVFWNPGELTLDGNSVRLTRQRDDVSVNNVPIEKCDLTATNGVVHVINEVIPEAVNKYVRSRGQRHRNGRRRHKKIFPGMADLTDLSWPNFDEWFDF